MLSLSIYMIYLSHQINKKREQIMFLISRISESTAENIMLKYDFATQFIHEKSDKNWKKIDFLSVVFTEKFLKTIRES